MNMFYYFLIQPICVASELFPVLSAHTWFRCSNNNFAVLVRRWARRRRIRSWKGLDSYLNFYFKHFKLCWREHIFYRLIKIRLNYLMQTLQYWERKTSPFLTWSDTSKIFFSNFALFAFSLLFDYCVAICC